MKKEEKTFVDAKMPYLKGSLYDKFKHIKVKPFPAQKIPYEELPLTFNEWQKMD